MSLTSLYLAPLDPDAAPDPADVATVLRKLGVIGEPLGGGTAWLAGDGFSRHIVFAGCSPYLVMQPPADGSLQFCHVALHGPFAAPRLVTGPNTVKPRCPACRARIDDWAGQLDAWRSGTTPAVCPRCGESLSPHRLDWRDHAVSGRVLVELRNVFPSEANPSDMLMQRLAEATAMPWRHAWAAGLVE